MAQSYQINQMSQSKRIRSEKLQIYIPTQGTTGNKQQTKNHTTNATKAKQPSPFQTPPQIQQEQKE